MNLLSSKSRRQLRGTFGRLLGEIGTLEQVTETNIGTGPTEAWTTKAEDVPYSLQPADAREVEKMTGGQMQGQGSYILYLKHDQSVSPTDRFITADGRALHFVFIQRRPNAPLLKCIVEEPNAV